MERRDSRQRTVLEVRRLKMRLGVYLHGTGAVDIEVALTKTPAIPEVPRESDRLGAWKHFSDIA